MPPKRSHTIQTISLPVPCDFVLPDFYRDAGPAEVGEALVIGASLYTTVTTERASVELEELAAAKHAEIARIKSAADAQITVLEAQIAQAERDTAALRGEYATRSKQMLEAQRTTELTARKEERELVMKQLDGRIRALESELAAAAEKNKALVERRAVVEAGRDADIRIAEERTRALLQVTLDEKERAIQRSEREVAKWQEAFHKQAEELRALADLIRRKPTNVKTKGSEYESMFREKLVAAYGTGDGFSLSDTNHSGVGHAGDYLMTWGEHTVLWEVKNYDKPVPTAEVEKFRRDVKENSHVRVGVMVSRYTPITGKVAKGDRDIEFIEGKMLIYLSNFEAMSDDALQFLLVLFRLWWDSERNMEEGEQMEATIRHIERLHDAAVKSKTEWRLHKTRCEEMLRWTSELVEENETKLKHALNILQGGGKVYDIPAHIFRPCDGDEKSAQLIQLILEQVVVCEGGVCVLNELADCVGKRKGLSRDTAKTHIKSVLLDGIVEPPKGKQPARIRGLALRGADDRMTLV